MLFWHVPAPNEALLISGSKHNAQGTPFRIVTGHGCFVLPVKQKARLLSLALREAEIGEECVTKQGIRLRVRAVAAFKVGDDTESIANAAKRFLSEQDYIEELVGRISAGHLRSIVGGLTVEEIIRERDRVSQEVLDGAHAELGKLGMVIDALQIQEIEDATGYISNLAAPHAAAVASEARIAEARADERASQEEQAASAQKAEYERNTAIRRAGFEAEVQQARARTDQAGPLAQARASQEVIEQQTALAQRQADLAAQRLEAEVRRPADAEAYRLRTLADAARDKARAETEAEAYRARSLAEAGRDTVAFGTEAETARRTRLAAADAEAVKVAALAAAEAAKAAADGRAFAERTVAEAEAAAIAARADALSSGNQQLIAANRLVEMLPQLVDAAASALGGAHLTVLNGTTGLDEVAAGVVGQGLALYRHLNDAVAAASASATAGAPAPAPAPLSVASANGSSAH